MSVVCTDDQPRVEHSTSQQSPLLDVRDTPEHAVDDASSDVAMEDEEVCINVNINQPADFV